MNNTLLLGGNHQTANMGFVYKLKNSEGYTKEASETLSNYFKTLQMESSFARIILPAEAVTAADIDVDLHSDEPMRILYLQKLAYARNVTFRATPETRYYQSKKVPMFFSKLDTPMFTKPLVELEALKIPFRRLMQDDFVKHIEEKEDGLFMGTVTSIINDRFNGSLPGMNAPDPTARVSAAGPFGMKHIVAAAQSMAKNRLTGKIVLVNEQDFAPILMEPATNIGGALAGDRFVNGMGDNTLAGYKIIRTTKNDIVAPGKAFMFPEPQYFGAFNVLNDLKAHVELKKGDEFNFYMFENIGMAIVNAFGMVEMEIV